MKLKRFRVKNFRSVIDSGWINCDDVTTLVGINESGKSNILLALWKLNPVRGGAIDILHDMPVTKLSDLRTKAEETVFIEAVFELGDSAEAINYKLSTHFTSEDELYVKRSYSGTISFDFEGDDAQKQLYALQKTKRIKGEEKPGLTLQDIYEIVKPHIPTFVYYSNYGNLTSRIYLPHAIKWLNGETVPGIDLKEDQVRTIRVLFDYVKLQPKEILDLGLDAVDLVRRRGLNQDPSKDDIKKAQNNKEQRSILLQSAGTKLSKDFREWWNQGEYKFRFEADGDYFYIKVSDDKRPEEVDLELRSTGLQWFLSFYLVFLMECQEENNGAILLLDEAGLTLHPLAQKDLSAFFNKLAENNQILNTTHSPFIVDSENIDRCRVVYTEKDGGTVVSEDLRKGSGPIGEKSIYAVHAALGLTVSDVLLQGSQIVVVEGVSDQFYLTAIKNALIRDKQFAPDRELLFIPAGGAKGVQGISGLISSKNDGLPLVVLDSDRAGEDFKKKLENSLYKDEIEKIITISDVVGMEMSEIEDLIPYDYISKPVAMFLGVQDEDDEFEPDENKPILPQIEEFARERDIILPQGWKVEMAKSFKKTLLGKRQRSIPERHMNMWIALFERFNR